MSLTHTTLEFNPKQYTIIQPIEKKTSYQTQDMKLVFHQNFIYSKNVRDLTIFAPMYLMLLMLLYSLITVRLTLVFLVGPRLKSTLHKQIPLSLSLILFRISFAGLSWYRKLALVPKTVPSDQCLPSSGAIVERTSNLLKSIRIINKVRSFTTCLCLEY